MEPTEYIVQPRAMKYVSFLSIDFFLLSHPADAPCTEHNGYFTLVHHPYASRDETPQPAFHIPLRCREHLQQFMDDLWACGIRPSSEEGNIGALSATQAHLKDLQSILHKTLDRALER